MCGCMCPVSFPRWCSGLNILLSLCSLWLISLALLRGTDPHVDINSLLVYNFLIGTLFNSDNLECTTAKGTTLLKDLYFCI